MVVSAFDQSYRSPPPLIPSPASSPASPPSPPPVAFTHSNSNKEKKTKSAPLPGPAYIVTKPVAQPRNKAAKTKKVHFAIDRVNQSMEARYEDMQMDEQTQGRLAEDRSDDMDMDVPIEPLPTVAEIKYMLKGDHSNYVRETGICPPERDDAVNILTSFIERCAIRAEDGDVEMAVDGREPALSWIIGKPFMQFAYSLVSLAQLANSVATVASPSGTPQSTAPVVPVPTDVTMVSGPPASAPQPVSAPMHTVPTVSFAVPPTALVAPSVPAVSAPTVDIPMVSAPPISAPQPAPAPTPIVAPVISPVAPPTAPVAPPVTVVTAPSVSASPSSTPIEAPSAVRTSPASSAITTVTSSPPSLPSLRPFRKRSGEDFAPPSQPWVAPPVQKPVKPLLNFADPPSRPSPPAPSCSTFNFAAPVVPASQLSVSVFPAPSLPPPRQSTFNFAAPVVPQNSNFNFSIPNLPTPQQSASVLPALSLPLPQQPTFNFGVSAPQSSAFNFSAPSVPASATGASAAPASQAPPIFSFTGVTAPEPAPAQTNNEAFESQLLTEFLAIGTPNQGEQSVSSSSEVGQNTTPQQPAPSSAAPVVTQSSGFNFNAPLVPSTAAEASVVPATQTAPLAHSSSPTDVAPPDSAPTRDEADQVTRHMLAVIEAFNRSNPGLQPENENMEQEDGGVDLEFLNRPILDVNGQPIVLDHNLLNDREANSIFGEPSSEVRPASPPAEPAENTAAMEAEQSQSTPSAAEDQEVLDAPEPASRPQNWSNAAPGQNLVLDDRMLGIGHRPGPEPIYADDPKDVARAKRKARDPNPRAAKRSG